LQNIKWAQSAGEIDAVYPACPKNETRKSIIAKKIITLLMAAVIVAGSAQTALFTAFAADPPAAPQNLKAVSVSYSSVKMTWSPVQSASGYVVYRFNSLQKAYERLSVTSKTSFINTGLVTAKTYYYKVRAYITVNGKNIYGAVSKSAAVKPVPSPPANLKASLLAYSSIKLSWSQVAGASGYIVYRYNPAKKTYESIKTLKTTVFINTGLTTGKVYYFKARAYRTAGGKNIFSTMSGSVNAKPVPAAPGSVSAAASNTSVKISWSAVSGATGYVVYRYNASNKSYNRVKVTRSTNFVNSSLVSGITYYYKVCAYRTVGGTAVYGKFSAVVSAKISAVSTTAATTVPSTTKPSTTIPSTTKPSTTIPSTTKPSTTIPSTTKPSTTMPSTTKPAETTSSTTTGTTSSSSYKGGELSKILETSKYTIKYDTQVDNNGTTQTVPVTTHISGNKIAFDTSMPYEGDVISIRLISNDSGYFAIVDLEANGFICYGKLTESQFNSVYPPLDLVNGYDANANYLGTKNVTYKGVNYISESYSKNGTTTEYYYKDEQLKRITVTDKEGTVKVFENVVFSATVDESVFTSPKDLGYTDATWLIGPLF